MKQKDIKKKKINIIPALVIILLIIMVSGSIFLYIRNQELQKKNTINSSGVEKVYKDKKFVFDDLEIIVSSKYNFLNTEKMQKQYEGKDIIEIPVQVKNVESTENNFSISYLKIYNEKGEEIRELGSSFKDKSFENSPKLGKGEMTIKNIYIPYNGNGKYKMVFKTFYEEKELEMEIKK